MIESVTAHRIGELIERKGLKRRAVAKAAGYSEMQLSAMLHGRRNIRDVDLLAIAKALDVGVAELFEGGDDHRCMKNRQAGSAQL